MYIYQHSVLEDTRLGMESASEEGPPLKENCLVLPSILSKTLMEEVEDETREDS